MYWIWMAHWRRLANTIEPFMYASNVAFLSNYFDHLSLLLIMVALWNRADHYIFMLWFVLSSSSFFISSPNLSRRRLDVYHTSAHGVVLV